MERATTASTVQYMTFGVSLQADTVFMKIIFFTVYKTRGIKGIKYRKGGVVFQTNCQH